MGDDGLFCEFVKKAVWVIYWEHLAFASEFSDCKTQSWGLWILQHLFYRGLFQSCLEVIGYLVTFVEVICFLRAGWAEWEKQRRAQPQNRFLISVWFLKPHTLHGWKDLNWFFRLLQFQSPVGEERAGSKLCPKLFPFSLKSVRGILCKRIFLNSTVLYYTYNALWLWTYWCCIYSNAMLKALKYTDTK